MPPDLRREMTACISQPLPCNLGDRAHSHLKSLLCVFILNTLIDCIVRYNKTVGQSIERLTWCILFSPSLVRQAETKMV